MVGKTFLGRPYLSRGPRIYSQCTLNANESLNHDFEYRMVAKTEQLLAEDIVSVVLKMIKP
jgi:hypothetical protein